MTGKVNMKKNYSLKVLIVFVLLTSMIFLNASPKQDKLIVFHIDFNSVSLKEDYLLKWIKKASDMGYNAILWEVEDEIKWDTCPECVSSDALTKEEFRDILNYSRTLGLEPIPLLQTIGHGEYVLQNQKYFSFREDSSRYDCYCTSNKDVQQFIRKWIIEYIDLFAPLKYFHLGGDEAYAFATCSDCRQIADEVGENELYAGYLKKIAEPLLEKGIRPGIWSDMMLSHADQLNAIPSEFIIWDWNYWDGDVSPSRTMVWGKGRLLKEDITTKVKEAFPEIVDQRGELVPFYTSDVLMRHGYDVILSSTSRSHGDGVFIGRNNLHVDNIYGAAMKTIDADLMGTCVTSWAVRIPNYETQEPWFYIAPITISNHTLGKKEILRKISSDLFGLDNVELFNNINQIGYPFPFVITSTTGIMWTGLKDSRPAPNDYIETLIDKWTERNRWSEYSGQVKRASNIIIDGTNKLEKTILKASKGFEILNNYSTASHFQYWQSIIANELVNRSENKNVIGNEEMVELVARLKNEYIKWANNWMTEISAEQNAGLIYDAIQNYFRSN